MLRDITNSNLVRAADYMRKQAILAGVFFGPAGVGSPVPGGYLPGFQPLKLVV